MSKNIRKDEVAIYCNGEIHCITKKDRASELIKLLSECWPKKIYTIGEGGKK